MRRTRDGVAKDCIDQQACQWPVGGLLSPLAEQMEDEEQRCGLRPVGRVERQIRIDFAKEDRNDLGTLRRCRLYLVAPLLANHQRGLTGGGSAASIGIP